MPAARAPRQRIDGLLREVHDLENAQVAQTSALIEQELEAQR